MELGPGRGHHWHCARHKRQSASRVAHAKRPGHVQAIGWQRVQTRATVERQREICAGADGGQTMSRGAVGCRLGSRAFENRRDVRRRTQTEETTRGDLHSHSCTTQYTEHDTSAATPVPARRLSHRRMPVGVAYLPQFTCTLCHRALFEFFECCSRNISLVNQACKPGRAVRG